MNTLKQLFLFALFLGLTLFGLDLFINTAGIENTSMTDYESELGRCRRKSMDFVSLSEGFSLNHFNEGRYLGQYVDTAKRENTLRIALLGDSYVEGFQVFERDHFAVILKEELTKTFPDKSIEVLNFGRSGFDMADMYAYRNTIVADYHPDISLFFVGTGDLFPNQTDPLIPRVKLGNGDLNVLTEESFNKSSVRNFQTANLISHRSTIFNMINKCRKLVKSGQLYPKLFDKFYFSKEQPSNSTVIGEKIADNKLNPMIKAIVDATSEDNTIFVNRAGVALDTVYTNYLSETEVRFIDLNDTLQELRKNDIDPNYWIATKKRGHWNQAGHKAVGVYLSEHIVTEIP